MVVRSFVVNSAVEQISGRSRAGSKGSHVRRRLPLACLPRRAEQPVVLVARCTSPRKRLPAALRSAPASRRSPGTSLPRRGAPRPVRRLPTTHPRSHAVAGGHLAGRPDRLRSFGQGGPDRRGQTPRQGRARRVDDSRLAPSFLTRRRDRTSKGPRSPSHHMASSVLLHTVVTRALIEAGRSGPGPTGLAVPCCSS